MVKMYQKHHDKLSYYLHDTDMVENIHWVKELLVIDLILHNDRKLHDVNHYLKLFAN